LKQPDDGHDYLVLDVVVDVSECYLYFVVVGPQHRLVIKIAVGMIFLAERNGACGEVCSVSVGRRLASPFFFFFEFVCITRLVAVFHTPHERGHFCSSSSLH
jgi:hypothetical protein